MQIHEHSTPEGFLRRLNKSMQNVEGSPLPDSTEIIHINKQEAFSEIESRLFNPTQWMLIKVFDYVRRPKRGAKQNYWSEETRLFLPKNRNTPSITIVANPSASHGENP